MSIKTIAAICLISVLTACAAPLNVFKVSDPETTKVIEGPVQTSDLKKVPLAITTTEAGLTGVAANNVGNSAVQGAGLLLGVLDDLTTPKYRIDLHLTLLDTKSGKVEEVEVPNLVGKSDYKVGDIVRVVYRKGGDFRLYNLTKYPKADQATR